MPLLDSLFFKGALLLTEVLKERDAQIEMKNGQLDAEKIREAHLLRLQQRVSDGTIQSIKMYLPKNTIILYKFCIFKVTR